MFGLKGREGRGKYINKEKEKEKKAKYDEKSVLDQYFSLSFFFGIHSLHSKHRVFLKKKHRVYVVERRCGMLFLGKD